MWLHSLWRYEMHWKMCKMGWFGAVNGHLRSLECHHSIEHLWLPNSYPSLIEICIHLVDLYRFRDTACYLLKFPDSVLLHMHLAPPLGMTSFQYLQDLWRQKTRVHGLSRGVVCIILRLAILIQCQLVADRWHTFVSVTFRYVVPRLKCQHESEARVWHFKQGTTYLNVTRTTVRHLFCRMTNNNKN